MTKSTTCLLTGKRRKETLRIGENPYKEDLKNNFCDVAPYIWYAGKKVHFIAESDSCDEAQALIDAQKAAGLSACALHKNGKHQVYGEKITRNPNTDIRFCEKCGNELESDICDDCGYDHFK